MGVGGHSYRIVVDYINVDSSSQPMAMTRYLMDASGNRSYIPLFQRTPETTYCEISLWEAIQKKGDIFRERVNIPVYIGVGIRITVNLTVKSGKVELAGLGSIAAAAKLEQVSGDLVIQTLGITGSKVATALPLPSELTPESIQNAIMAMATIKSGLYSTAGDVIITPRVVGFYDPLGFGQQQYVNAVVAELARKPIVWNSAC